MMENDPESIRIAYKYRRLILEGKIKLPYREAARLIGPDSAYRLYFTRKTKNKTAGDGES